MALPKPSRPEYSTTIPSTGKKIKYQPFTVREEKVLMLASESEDMDEVANAIENVLSSCVTHPSDLKVSELALFDIEFLFLRARAKSVGEKIKIRVTDPNDRTYNVDHEINIDSIKVDKTDGHVDIIDIDEDTKIKMRYPGINFFAEGIKVNSLTESNDTIALCISQIIIGDEVYNSGDMTNEEVAEWLDGLTTSKYRKILEFFETMPKLRHVIKLKNKNTGNDFSVKLEGLADFF